MNLAFYIQELNGSEENEKIYSCLADAVKANKIKDASIFVNNINHTPSPIGCGVFNSTELWNYTGILITDTISNAVFASKVVNKFKHVFMATNKEKNLMNLIAVVNFVPSFVCNEEQQKEIHRITGKLLPVVELEASKILEEFTK